MSSERVLLSVPEGAGVCCASAPDVMRGSLTHGELMFGLMRLRPRTGDTGDLEIFLKRLVEDTRLLFGASGAAVALLDGPVCRWRIKCGESGPQIGSEVLAGSGISGECLSGGRVQLCHDTLLDPRFDAELCIQLHLRSMIVAPIRCPARIAGILEAWSSQPLAFDSGCTEMLQKLADFSGRVTGLGRGFEERSQPAQIAVATRRMASFGEEICQRAQKFATLVQAKMNVASAEVLPLMMKLRTRGIVPAVLLSTILGAAWYGRAASVKTVPSSSHASAYPSTGATLVNAALDTPIPASEEALPRPEQATQPAREWSRPAALTSFAHGSATGQNPLLVASEVRDQGPVLADDAPVPPLMALGALGGWKEDAVPLAHLFASNPVNPRPVQKTSRSLTGGQLRLRVPPVYPSLAVENEIEGTVVLQAAVDKDGRVQEVYVKKGHPLLASAAIAAVKRWRYQPLLLGDSPVPMTAQISVNFKLK